MSNGKCFAFRRLLHAGVVLCCVRVLFVVVVLCRSVTKDFTLDGDEKRRASVFSEFSFSRLFDSHFFCSMMDAERQEKASCWSIAPGLR